MGTVFDITSKFKESSIAPTAANAAASDMTPNYVAEFNYIAKEVDEINLEKGDVLHVEDKGTDNWFFGTNITKQTKGTFPGNFVSPLGPRSSSISFPAVCNGFSMVILQAVGSKDATYTAWLSVIEDASGAGVFRPLFFLASSVR